MSSRVRRWRRSWLGGDDACSLPALLSGFRCQAISSRSDVVDVGERRSGAYQIAESDRRMCSYHAPTERRARPARGAGARQRIRRDDRAGGVFGSVDSVAVAGHRPDFRRAGQRERQASRNSVLRPPRPGRRRSPIETVVSPPDNSTAAAPPDAHAAHRSRDAGHERCRLRAPRPRARRRGSAAYQAFSRGLRRGRERT